MRNFLISVFISAAGLASSQQADAVIIDFAEASALLSIDSDRMPGNYWKSFIPLQFALLEKSQPEAIEKAFQEEFNEYAKMLGRRLPENTGQLVQFRIYSNEFGTKFLPKDFLVPVGAGVDPVDAYSNYINLPTLQPAPLSSPGLIDESYYIWIQKKEGRLHSGMIPREPFTSDFKDFVERANFWNLQATTFEQDLRAAGRLEKAQQLVSQFKQLQAEQHRLIQKYESLRNKMDSNESLFRTAEFAINLGLTISSLVASTESSDQAIKTTDAEISLDPKLIRQQNSMIEKEVRHIKNRIESNTNDIKILEKDIQATFRINHG